MNSQAVIPQELAKRASVGIYGAYRVAGYEAG